MCSSSMTVDLAAPCVMMFSRTSPRPTPKQVKQHSRPLSGDQGLSPTRRSPGQVDSAHACPCTLAVATANPPTIIPQEVASYLDVKGINLERIDGYCLEDLTLGPLPSNLRKWHQPVRPAETTRLLYFNEIFFGTLTHPRVCKSRLLSISRAKESGS
jgi:hypothetical protein